MPVPIPEGSIFLIRNQEPRSPVLLKCGKEIVKVVFTACRTIHVRRYKVSTPLTRPHLPTQTQSLMLPQAPSSVV